MNIIKGALGGASLCVLASVGTPALAADAQAIIVVGERIAQTQEVPGGADSVAADQFEDQLAVSLRDTLAFSPGVYAQPRFGQEVRLSIRGSGISRGFHMRGLTLLQDGIPINLADDNGDFQELDPQVFDRIDVYRGANALRFGGSTLGGAINAVTPTGRSRAGVGLRIDGGSFDTLRGMLSYGYADEDRDGWFAVSADTSDGDRQHARRHSIRLNGNAGFRLSESVETRFYASLNNIEQELPGALTLTNVLDAPETGNFANDQKRDIDSIRLQNRTSVRLGDASLDVGAFYNKKELFHPIYQVIDQNSHDWGLFGRLDWAAGPVELTLGTTARFGEVDSRRYLNVNGRKGTQTFGADLSARTVNVYGEARYRVAGGLSLVAGAVYSDGRREQVPDFATMPATVEDEAHFSEFSPKFGLLYEARPNVQFYANYSRSHELPGFGELVQAPFPPAVATGFVPVDAQRAWTFEIGTRGSLGIAAWDVSLYRADIDGEMLQFAPGNDATAPAATFNADETRHQGVEAGLDLALATWATLRQVYQYNDFRFVDDAEYGDNRLPVVPKHLYRAQLRLGTERFSIAPTIEWLPQGAYVDYVNSFRPDGYALVGVQAEAEVRRGVTLFVDARNLTGKEAVGDISAVVSNTGTAIYYPVERRAVYGGVRARF